ncbi:MAG: ATP-dependent DNA ligase [Candidatus Aenigmarchaeota archaeon]|nr:ATP-dependent DNA ligase [Candidatus Aenigmarchaeota archaeon]
MPERQLIFVVQEHHATHLHWDFRIEVGDVLKSWAVPKEPPLEAGVKRLAIEVQDHSLEYADFEGTIPEGQYGAGTVKIWDIGTYVPEKISENEILVELRGKKMMGKYVLLKAHFKGAKNSWLLFKKIG